MQTELFYSPISLHYETPANIEVRNMDRMAYIFSEEILGTNDLATSYLANEPYKLPIDVWTVFSPIVISITFYLLSAAMFTCWRNFPWFSV